MYCSTIYRRAREILDLLSRVSTSLKICLLLFVWLLTDVALPFASGADLTEGVNQSRLFFSCMQGSIVPLAVSSTNILSRARVCVGGGGVEGSACKGPLLLSLLKSTRRYTHHMI
jgi:hypothetical protein